MKRLCGNIPQSNLTNYFVMQKNWSMSLKSFIALALLQKFLYRRSLLCWRAYIMRENIVSMSSVRRWGLQEEHSIIIYFAVQIAVVGRRNRPNSC